MMGEVALATCGMEISTVNSILDQVIGMYEKDFVHAPQGKIFKDCYDVKELEPSDEYVDIYDQTIDLLGKCGFDM